MKTIILVEDEHSVRELLVEFLQDLGYRVHSFETADLAWRHIRQSQHPVRLLITDLCLPGDLDGVDLVKRVRSVAPDTPIVVISGFHKNADSLCMEDLRWLGKPFSLHSLETVCQEILAPD